MPADSSFWPAHATIQPEALSYRLQHGTLPQRIQSPAYTPARSAYGSFAAGRALQPDPATPSGYPVNKLSIPTSTPPGQWQDTLRSSSFYQPSNSAGIHTSPASFQQAQRSSQPIAQARGYDPSASGQRQELPSQALGLPNGGQDALLNQLMRGLSNLTNEVSELRATRQSVDSSQGKPSGMRSGSFVHVQIHTFCHTFWGTVQSGGSTSRAGQA